MARGAGREPPINGCGHHVINFKLCSRDSVDQLRVVRLFLEVGAVRAKGMITTRSASSV